MTDREYYGDEAARHAENLHTASWVSQDHHESLMRSLDSALGRKDGPLPLQASAPQRYCDEYCTEWCTTDHEGEP